MVWKLELYLKDNGAIVTGYMRLTVQSFLATLGYLSFVFVTRLEIRYTTLVMAALIWLGIAWQWIMSRVHSMCSRKRYGHSTEKLDLSDDLIKKRNYVHQIVSTQ